MYHPYLRGKQYELMLLRENAKLLKNASMVPIIEPVKKNLTTLNKAVDELKKENVPFVLIINPSKGDLKNDLFQMEEFIDTVLAEYDNFHIGYLVGAESELTDIVDFLNKFINKSIAFLHNGYPKAKELAESINQFSNVKKHIFLDEQILYRRAFKKDGIERVLIRDGFIRQIRGKDYPDNEAFSELHLTYSEMGLQGFGDFLIAGNGYSESGGPAYTVAIHLTYLGEDDLMNIYHFKSDRNDTPKDPAGKFEEALKKLITTVEEEGSLVYQGKAYRQYKKFYVEGHYPGLGFIKKLSMQHHIEIISNYFSGQ